MMFKKVLKKTATSRVRDEDGGHDSLLSANEETTLHQPIPIAEEVVD